MDNIIDIIPDNKGGQLKFRVTQMSCRYSATDELPKEGVIVDIYINSQSEERPFGIPRDADMNMINELNLTFGRPKGYGVVVWNEGALSQVLWTAFIGDEGYFSGDML